MKRYVFDAGNSKTGVAGLVIAVRAYRRKGAFRLANDFLRQYLHKPLEIEVEKPRDSRGFVGGRSGCVLRRPSSHKSGTSMRQGFSAKRCPGAERNATE